MLGKHITVYGFRVWWNPESFKLHVNGAYGKGQVRRISCLYMRTDPKEFQLALAILEQRNS